MSLDGLNVHKASAHAASIKCSTDLNPEQAIQAFEYAQLWSDALQNRTGIHDSPAIYAIVTSAPFQRLNSQSRILYIGKTGCLGGSTDRCRLYTYRYAPKGQHGSRVRDSVAEVQAIGHSIYLRWKKLATEAEAVNWEQKILAAYLVEHLELPPFNRRT